MGCLPSRSTIAPTGSTNPNSRENRGTTTTTGTKSETPNANDRASPIHANSNHFGARDFESERDRANRLISQRQRSSRDQDENMSVNMNDSHPNAMDRSEPQSRSSSPKGNMEKNRADENGDEMYNSSSLNQSIERESAESPTKTRDKTSFDVSITC